MGKKRVLFSSATTATARLSHMLVMFAVVPIALNYLGPEKYGLWMAATSLVMVLISFGDGGISNSLITAVAKAKERGGHDEVRAMIGAAAAIIIPLSMTICLLAFLLVQFVDWQWVFNLRSALLASEAQKVVLVVLSSVAIGFVVNIIMRARHGLQQIPSVNFWETLASLAILPAIYAAVFFNSDMVWVTIAVAMTPLAVKAFGSLLFLARNSDFIPKVRDVTFSNSKSIAASGSVFFIITISQAIAIQSDQVLIANIIGTKDVADYSVMNRLFTVPYIAANFLLLSLWPAFSAASARGDFQWIRSTFWKVFWGVGIFGCVISSLLYFFLDDILKLWVGDIIKPDFWLSFGMLLYAVFLILVGICSTLSVSLDIRRPQIWISLSMMIVNLPLSYFLIHEIGAGGAIIATAVSYLLCMIIPYLVLLPRYLNQPTVENEIKLSAKSDLK
ncbi:MAG: oligosaccharide flippase family protein [Hyphomicrobiales bacterium]